MVGEEHKRHSVEHVDFCLVVTSTRVYRGEKPDMLTPLVKNLVESAGHRLVSSAVVPNDPAMINDAVGVAVERCDVVLVTGGTGPSPRDVSVDVVASMADREFPGFGEIFRLLTYQRHGPVAWLSRASAYVVNWKLVVVVPGSEDAVKLALKELLLPEVGHVVGELHRKPG